MPIPSPHKILTALLPTLRLAAAYAQEIQPRIVAQPDKEGFDSTFAAALTDADLSVQTLVEVALLAQFPQLNFYGEEYAKSYNTKYFPSLDIPEPGHYLLLLDPIDGTQFYKDGHSNYHVIFSIVDGENYWATIALNPARQRYYFALRGQGAYTAALDQPLEAAQPFTMASFGDPATSPLYLGSQLAAMIPHLPPAYPVINLAQDYSTTIEVPNHTDFFTGRLAGSALATGKLIDAAAIAFFMQEAGAIVSTLSGQPFPPIRMSYDYDRPGGLIIGTSPTIHRVLLTAAQAASLG